MSFHVNTPYGHQLGLDRPFLEEVAAAAIRAAAATYPGLAADGGYIRRIVALEEERFLENLRRGMPVLREVLDYLKNPVGPMPALLAQAGVTVRPATVAAERS